MWNSQDALPDGEDAPCEEVAGFLGAAAAQGGNRRFGAAAGAGEGGHAQARVVDFLDDGGPVVGRAGVGG